jgi:hypothetical protein
MALERRKETSLIRFGPFLLQLVMLLGGYFALRQQVSDLQDTVNNMNARFQAEIIELRSHAWRN